MAPIAIIRAVTSLQISTSLARKSKIRTSPRLPVAPVEAPNKRGVTLIPDAAEILGEAQRAGVNLILHGHQHKPKLSLYQDLPLNGGQLFDAMYVVANGSAGARQTRLPTGERNTYCLFELGQAGIGSWMRELRLDGVAGAEIYQGKLSPLPILGKDRPSSS